MSILAKQKVAGVWSQIVAPRALATPSKSKPFTVVSNTSSEMTIEVGVGKNLLVISRENLEATIDYLNMHDHDQHRPCRIDANADPVKAGPLCLACRKTPAGDYGPRLITYVLPILADVGVVWLNGDVPATTWLI